MSKAPLQQLLSTYRHFCVGSLPFVEPEMALDFVLGHPTILPFWPELPNRSARELSLEKGKRAVEPDWNGFDTEEASCLELVVGAVGEKKINSTLLKCQILGPFSLALALCAEQGVLREKVILADQACRKQLIWLCDYLAQAGLQSLVVLDEPWLDEFSNIPAELRTDFLDIYSYFFSYLAERKSYLGLHCCGEISSELFELPVELISFDALSVDPLQLEEAVKKGLVRGQVICPGVVPAVADPGQMHEISERGSKLWSIYERFSFEALGAHNHGLLHAANCGHAGASYDWLASLYSEM